jgi:hypothetical protein
LNHAEWRHARGTDLRITRVWHPEPKSEIWNGQFGSARVEAGDAAYQLSTGEIIELEVSQ